MSEQIREQVSAFLDGELPNSETELLLKRLTRDGELRESFGRYALIGEALRGGDAQILTRGFASRVNLAIDGEPAQVPGQAHAARPGRWWRPLAGVTVAAGVATVAIIALQQRAISPGLRAAAPNTAQPAQTAALPLTASATQSPAQGGGGPREALSYTVPATSLDAPAAISPARLTNYIFAHSQYSSGLGQRGMLADLLIEDDEPQLIPIQRAAPTPPAPEVRVAP
ncbi:MAG TPA: sigma-E factor negative regulatory protein [Steroidobacteraceae bacterium]|jgi:sigma-E factor negative regulatory protein RseA|nr:sigma-E factor negative regulatory protein [Steroidobacteraceae bacterium]